MARRFDGCESLKNDFTPDKDVKAEEVWIACRGESCVYGCPLSGGSTAWVPHPQSWPLV
jgi:hypothetical protein